jgi:hypothetical protein
MPAIGTSARIRWFVQEVVMGFRIRFGVVSLALGVLAATPAPAQGFLDKLKQSVGGNYTVRGRVQVQDGQWLTCFDGIKTGYLGPIDLARPGDARTDPATGKLKVTTAAIPTVILTRTGVVTSNDCDSLAEQKLLSLPTSVIVAQGGGETGYSDGLGCTDPSWTKEEIVRRRREIMECQSDAITERAAQRIKQREQAAASGTAASGDTGYRDIAGTKCVTPDMTGDYIASHRRELHECQMREAGARAWDRSMQDNAAARAQGGGSQSGGSNAAAQKKLEAETREKFAAIQSQAGAPAAAPAAQSAEDLAWDGAKLCNLKPAYMLKLKDEAVGFVRIDGRQDKIILSEPAGGARREVAVDGAGFAQRVSFNAQAIGQGGDTCGRAFWNAEAYKAASAAMSGG